MNEFVRVSPMGQVINWGYVSPDYLLSEYAGTMRYDEVKEFIETSRPGHFISLDEAHLLFRVTQK